jgi:hypothetical protein
MRFVLTIAAAAALTIGKDVDPVLTPGVIGTTNIATVCTTDYPERYGRIDTARANAVFDRYHVTGKARPLLRVTFLIPPGIGGTNDLENLWPVDKHTMQEKDDVDLALRQAVCSAQIELRDAQKRVRSDWRRAPDF